MQHRYSSENKMGGLWIAPDAGNIFCSWWWDAPKSILYVRRGKATRTWAPKNLNPSALRLMFIDLPDIARGIGRQLEDQQERSDSCIAAAVASGNENG